MCEDKRGYKMIDRKEIVDIVQDYNPDKIKIGAIASHSALDVFDGAVEEDFRTFAICQQGREKTYSHYFKAQRDAYER
jgi:5-formaminoimidazole-4-carboxamide-1-(beta)-D-ribofuranosyl 5'-monophosphate synthetase